MIVRTKTSSEPSYFGSAHLNVVHKGKELEEFVAATEKLAAHDSVSVEVNRKEFFDSGIQRIEYDIFIEDLSQDPPQKILIECRDRPSKGTADGAWIEQIAGRRLINGFTDAVAVSTTGFSESAVFNARAANIQLRTVEELETPKDWLGSSFRKFEKTGTFSGFKHINVPDEYRDKVSGLVEYLKDAKGDVILSFEDSSDELKAREFFQKVCLLNQNLTYEGLPCGIEKSIRVFYNENNGGLGRAFIRFHETQIGVSWFLMEGSVVVRESTKTFPSIKLMAEHESGKPISQAIELPDISWASKSMSFFEIYKPDGSRQLNLRLEQKSQPSASTNSGSAAAAPK